MAEPTTPAQFVKCCRTCEHFNDHGTWCRKWEAAPPEDVKPVGCDEYSYDEIPF